MIYNAQEYKRLQNSTIAISAIAWFFLLKLSSSASSCCGGDCASPMQIVLALNPPISLAFDIIFTSNPPSSLARDWALMLLAMMTPLLVQPIYHIRISSFKKRQARSIALFLVGYAEVWMPVGSILLLLMLLAKILMYQSFLPAICGGLIALVWQTSPFKQRCLNRCHSHRSLAAFGRAADWDAFCMGLEHGYWCTGSCWALMLFSMLLPHSYLIAMVGVSILMFSERLDPPQRPSWEWRGFETALRYLSLRLRAIRRSPLVVGLLTRT